MAVGIVIGALAGLLFIGTFGPIAVAVGVCFGIALGSLLKNRGKRL